MKHNKDVEHQDIKMYCSTNQFPELKFIGTHHRPHGVRGLGKHYHMSFDIRLGHDTYAIRSIPCDFTLCNSIIE